MSNKADKIAASVGLYWRTRHAHNNVRWKPSFVF